MNIFKRKNNLEKRLESLENFFGLFYTLDEDGCIDHKRDADDNWNTLSQLEKRIKALEEKGKK